MGIVVIKTGHHEEYGHPNGILQSTETIIPTPIKVKKESKPFLAGGQMCG